MQHEIKALHEAALNLGTHLMAHTPDTSLAYIEQAIRAGGRIVMELGPLPDMRRVDMVMVEPEGRRVTIASQTWEVATLN